MSGVVAAVSNLTRGFLVGCADVVPGVSGGTMAYILGIYPRLLAAIRGFDVALLKLIARGRLGIALTKLDLALLVPLGFGVIAAVLFFTRVVPIPLYLHTHPETIYAVFFGLILGSIWTLTRAVDYRHVGHALILIAAVVAGWLLVSARPQSIPDTPVITFLCGVLAFCAMLLPGISGSFVLLLLGKYGPILDGVSRLEPGIFIPFVVGAAVGLLSFSRFLGYLLHRHHDITVMAMNGLLIASLWVIWPFQDRQYEVIRGKEKLAATAPRLPSVDDPILLAVALTIASTLLVITLERLASRRHAVA